MMIRRIVLLVAMLLCSCATTPTGPTYSQSSVAPAPGKALVVFYRTGGFKGAAYNNSVFINNTLAAKIPPESFTYFQLAPGDYELNSGPPGTPKHFHLTISVFQGQTYYVRYYAGDSLSSGEGLRIDSSQTAIEYLSRGYRYAPSIQETF
jgi:hypothetical protein